MIYTTRKTLLEAIKDGEEVSWHEFYTAYRPLIILRGSDFQLTVDEKEELVQLVLLAIFHNCKTFQYDRSKGQLRDYLRKLIGRKAVDILRKRKNNHVSENMLDYLPDKDSLLEQAWNAEWQGHLLTQAVEMLRYRLKPVTFQAFELHVINERTAKEVAAFLNISVNMVYVAKSRAIEKLRVIIRELQDSI